MHIFRWRDYLNELGYQTQQWSYACTLKSTVSFWFKIRRGRISPNLNWVLKKMYIWHSLLHELSCKLSGTSYPLHLCQHKFANSSFPYSCQHWVFFLFTSSISGRDTGPGARSQPEPVFDLVCRDVLLWAWMDKVFLEEPQTKLYSHCAEIMGAREGEWHSFSLPSSEDEC